MLAAIFVAFVLITARWKGARALLGLAASLVVIVFFIVPAILNGESPQGVALVGSLAVMLLTIVLAHGVGPKSIAACLGTASALLLTLFLADLFIEAADLSGLASEEAVYPQRIRRDGVRARAAARGHGDRRARRVDDLTVDAGLDRARAAQGEPGVRLRRALPACRRRRRRPHRSDGDTLVLAYAGAALPSARLSLAGTLFREAVGFEIVAGEIVATLVGSIGLIAAVP